MESSAGGVISLRSPEKNNNVRILWPRAEMWTQHRFPLFHTSTQCDSISSSAIYIHFSCLLYFFLECSIWLCWLCFLNVYSEPYRSPRSVCCLISISVWLREINDINPRIAATFSTAWIETTFIKSLCVGACVCVCVCCSQIRWWGLKLWDGPYISISTWGCFAGSSRASAGQWIMSRRWRRRPTPKIRANRLPDTFHSLPPALKLLCRQRWCASDVAAPTCLRLHWEVRLPVDDAVHHPGTVPICWVIRICGCHLHYHGSCGQTALD